MTRTITWGELNYKIEGALYTFIPSNVVLLKFYMYWFLHQYRNPPTSNDIRLPESAFRFFFDQINETILAFYKTSMGQKGLKTFFVVYKFPSPDHLHSLHYLFGL